VTLLVAQKTGAENKKVRRPQTANKSNEALRSELVLQLDRRVRHFLCGGTVRRKVMAEVRFKNRASSFDFSAWSGFLSF
jgi:hypothetical protein